MDSTILDYELISLKGSGAFGYVIEAYDRINDTRVAIKRTHKVDTKLSREYEILSKLKDCEYIIKLMDIFYSVNEDGKIIQNLVFEYVNRSLQSFIDDYYANNKYIPLDIIKKISQQILLGLDFCHKKNIVHRDLKPENILLTEDHKVKICDFGCSKYIKENTSSTPLMVCRYYRAPELILGKTDYNEKIDIFATGCIIAELFMLTPLFPGITEGMQIFEYMCLLGNPGKEYFSKFDIPKNHAKYFGNVKIRGIHKFDELINKDRYYDKQETKNAANLILNMLKWDINKRYSAEQCLNHPFLNSKGKDITPKYDTP